MRRIFSAIKSKQAYVVTHSHGAAVVSNLLFNVKKFPKAYYEDSGINGGKFITDSYDNVLYNTPTQEIFVGMLAPAIPGINVFDEYSHRTVNGKNQINNMKNYHFVVGFNKNDMVTNKFFTNPAWYGTTTLGSLRSELDETVAYFGNNQLFDFEDFSRFRKRRQISHSWFKYMANKPTIESFLNKVMRQE